MTLLKVGKIQSSLSEVSSDMLRVSRLVYNPLFSKALNTKLIKLFAFDFLPLSYMYDKDLEAYLKDLDALKKKVTRNKKSAIEFLVGAGIIYKNGKLRAPYKGLSIQK